MACLANILVYTVASLTNDLQNGLNQTLVHSVIVLLR